MRKDSFLIKTALCLMGCILLSSPSQACFMIGDLDGNCRVDIDDLVLMASQWMDPLSCGSEAGLVAHWKLNEVGGTIAADSSGSGYNGIVETIAPPPDWNPAGGILGGALQFDGEYDHVRISQNPVIGYPGITGSNPRTSTAWIKTDQPSGQIMTWGYLGADTNGWIIWVNQTGVLRVDVGGGYIFGTTVLTDDFWHHIAVTSDGSTTDQIALYVDGKIETIGEIVPQSIDTQGTTTVNLGVYYCSSPGSPPECWGDENYLGRQHFDGLIDDARIYDRALSMQEIWSIAKTASTDYACADMNMDETVNLIDMAKMSQDWKDVSPMITISEFLADNESKSPLEPSEILDGNGESSDWIEIHNNSEMTIDISDWYLTDEADLKTQWQFPSGMGQLQPGDYLIVFASEKTQAGNPGNYPYVDPAGYLHTNFKLSTDGEYLGLIHSDGTTPMHEYDHFNLGGGEFGYPEQEEDISYGLYYDQTRYFSAPTPGRDNIRSPFVGFVEKPDVNIEGGCYQNAVDVTLSCGTAGAFIRYTTDGTVPGLDNGSDPNGPIHIDSLTALIAKAFKPGLQRSDARIETYIFVDSALAPFNSNLPIVVVDTFGVTIPQDKVNKPWTDCGAVIIDIDDITGRADITGPEHFAGVAQIRYRGESTYGTKRHFAFEVQDEYGQDKSVSLLGMPAESDWIITGERLDRTLLKKNISFKWFQDMGHWAPRLRYVEMYINDNGGATSESDYKGIFMLMEKIKRDNNRLDIARLDASHNLEPQVSGGYIVKCDKADAGDTVIVLDGISPNSSRPTTIVEPGYDEITQPQIDWIVAYLNEFNSVLWQDTGSSHYPGPQAEYGDYVDVVSWIDHFIVEEIGNDADALNISYFIHKYRNGKIHSGPPWDFDRAFHENAKGSRPHNVWRSGGGGLARLHNDLQGYLEYKMLFADRWFQHRETILNTALSMAHIDDTVALITEAMARSIDKYGFAGIGGTYAGEIVLFKNWITNRLNWLDFRIADPSPLSGATFAGRPPILIPSGSYINSGDSVEINLPSEVISGTVHYTLNGEDPRLEGGGINPNASIYIDPGSGGTTETITIVTEDAAKAVWVPVADIGTSWTGGAEPYDDSTWTHGTPPTGVTVGGVGYDENPDYVSYITYDVESLMNNIIATCYIRIPFTAEADDVADATSMTLRIRYDDGFRAYLNGTEIASDNAPSSPNWNTGAAGQHSDSSAVILLDFDCSAYLGSLLTGDNILAIRGFNQGTGSSDFLISAELVIDVESTPTPGSGGITLDKSTCVKARIKDVVYEEGDYAQGEGWDWSAMNTEVYAVGPVLENLRITELMYHPTNPTPAEIAALDPNLIDEDFEFIELKNTGGVALNLNLVHFTDGIDFTFGDYTLAAGDYTVLVKNQAAFAERYGTGMNIVPGSYLGYLDNGGEEIVLRDAIGAEIHDFDYNDSWYDITDGDGFSLTIKDADATDPNLWDRKAGWRPSAAVDGSPGVDDTGIIPEIGAIVINEILAHSDTELYDWIELYNTTGSPINIGGWFLSDNNDDEPSRMKYEIAEGTAIDPNDYIVFYENLHFGNPADPGCNEPFQFSENGEISYLQSGSSGVLTGYYEEEDFGASEPDVAFGRYQKSTGTFNFVAMNSNTPNHDNVYPKVGPIVINEIMYHPLINSNAEYMELLNISGSSVTLYDFSTSEPWQFIDDAGDPTPGIEFYFPTGSPVTMDDGEYLLLVKNLAAFTSEFGAPAPALTVLEWTTGSLGNGGEEPLLSMPGDLDGSVRQYIRVDKVHYSDGSHPPGDDPWPTGPDGDNGDGSSLSRKVPANYGNDVANWQAASPTPGTVNP